MSAGPIPWSPERETSMRRKIVAAWTEMWVGAIAGVAFLCFANIYRKPLLVLFAAAALGYAMVCLRVVIAKRAELGEEMRRLPSGQFFEGSGMLANKPRSTANLTEYRRWPDTYAGYDLYGFRCQCGRPHSFANAQWIPNFDPGELDDEKHPNPVDRGGGRFVILCPCGLGHYKLKA